MICKCYLLWFAVVDREISKRGEPRDNGVVALSSKHEGSGFYTYNSNISCTSEITLKVTLSGFTCIFNNNYGNNMFFTEKIASNTGRIQSYFMVRTYSLLTFNYPMPIMKGP